MNFEGPNFMVVTTEVITSGKLWPQVSNALSRKFPWKNLYSELFFAVYWLDFILKILQWLALMEHPMPVRWRFPRCHFLSIRSWKSA